MTHSARITTGYNGLPLNGRDGSAAEREMLPEPTSKEPMNLYAELKRRVTERGLFERQSAYYFYLISIITSLLIAGFILLLAQPRGWWLSADAALLAFVFTQIGFLGHDAGHRQIFRAARHNDLLGLILGDLLVGLSYRWWIDKHNRHHANPNQIDLDPDIDIPGIAFSEDLALRKHGWARFIVKYQAFFFIPLLALGAFNFHFRSILYLLRERRVKWRLAEALLLLAHFSLYYSFLFLVLGVGRGVLFLLIHQGLFGMYMGLSFASNHKGMPLLDKTASLSFLHQQVLTTRNLREHLVTDFLFGSLSCQIEHHLFPTMPRWQLRHAAKVVRAFCLEHAISYHETGVLASFREVFGHLHQVSAPVRHATTQLHRDEV